MGSPAHYLDIKEKLPSDILFFAYNLTPGSMVKKVQQFEHDPELRQIAMEHQMEMQKSLSQMGGPQGQMIMAPPGGEPPKMDVNQMNFGYN
jgi:hypothetical protein